jgi:hypothetical protein
VAPVILESLCRVASVEPYEADDHTSRISAVSKTINLLGRRLLESFGAKLLCHLL